MHSAFTQLARAELVAGNEFLMSKRKGVSMETVETGLDPPLQNYDYSELKQRTKYKKSIKKCMFH